MTNDGRAKPDIHILNSRIAALEQLIEVYENSVVEQADKLYREIAERTAADKALRESEEILRNIADTAQDAIVMANGDGEILFWNRAAERIFGYSAAEAKGKEVHTLIIPKGFRHGHLKGLARFRETGKGPLMGKTTEVSALRRDGTEFPLELALSAVMIRDKWCATGIARDITERKEAEEEIRRLNAGLEERVAERTAELEAANKRLAEAYRELHEREARIRESQCLLRAIIDNSTAIIYVKDLEGRYLMINHRYEELFHVTQEAVTGKTDHDIFPPEQADALRAFDQRVIVAGKVMEAEEVAPQDDGPHTYLSIKAPLSDAAGNHYAICGISADITGRKRDEEEIRRLNTELEQKIVQLQDAQEELVRKEKLAILGQLSGSVGHELRNPLGVMSNAVYFLQMVLADADETTREYLGIIKSEIDNSQRIITDLLDFARTKTPQTKAVTAHELVNESLGRCVIPDNVELRTDLPDTLPAVRIDPLQMGQVLQNLITNGVQAMPEGGALRVTTRCVGAGLVPAQEQEGQPQGLPLREFIEISVEDTGEGITPENMKKLFQPLFTTKAKGIGLGLVVCKNLVEANGGRIEVESRLGGGTTFAVVLPVEG